MAFGYKRTLTIDHTKVSTGSQTNFPVLIYISDATLKTVANGGHVENSSAHDICFYSDSGLTTALTWEIDSYDGTNGVLWAWVLIASLSNTVDTTIYVAYGDSTISTFQSTVANVWDSNYKAVYHFGTSSSLSCNDSTSNANNGSTAGTNTPAATTGKIGGAVNFSGTNPRIEVGDTTSLRLTTAGTMSAWINIQSAGVYNVFASKGNYYGDRNLYLMRVSSTPKLVAGVANNTTGAYAVGGTTLNTGTWYFVTLSWDGTTGIKTYLNGATGYEGSAGVYDSVTTGYPFWIGNNSTYNSPFIGYEDELHVSDIFRAEAWRVTEYNNQSSPSTFISVGAEAAALSVNQQSSFFLAPF